MMNPCTEVSTISIKDVLNTLALFIDNGGYSDDELLYFVSYLTGISEDKILETIEENHLPDNSQDDELVQASQGLSRERVMDMFRSYVSNDAEAAELDYVQEALTQAGCCKEDAKKLGLGWVFPEEDEENA